MKHIVAFFIIILSFNITAQNYKTHTVKSGETVYSIAKQYLVTPFDIYALNPDAKTSLKINSVLIIPNSKVKNDPIAEETREIIGYKTHKVRRKETLYSLAEKYNITEDDIKKANRHLYAENLRKGERIEIPKFKTIVSKQTLTNTIKKYRVQPTEGKWRIAYKFGITVEELEDLNPNMNEVIQPGDELNVPNIANSDEKPIETAYDYYEVLPKEGFYRLNIKTGLTQEQLETLNPELKETGLKAGMVLKIPKSEASENGSSNANVTQLSNSISNYKTKKIGVMLPFQLHTIDIDSVSRTKKMIRDKRLLSVVLDFHSGVLMALDSAKQLGISTDLKVFDTEYKLATTQRLLNQYDFEDYDAVIGPMEAQSFDMVANKLKSDRVPVIAALNKPMKVYSNVFQTIPKDELLKKAMIRFVKNDSLKNNIIIIADRAQSAISAELKETFPSATQLFSERDKKTGKDDLFIYPVNLEKTIQPGKTYVFLQTTSNSFTSSVISMLNGFIDDEKEIILVTLDKNKAFEGKNIDNYHLSNLKFHYPSINKHFEEGETESGFVKNYKTAYGVHPNKYASRGFDITMDLLLRLSVADDLFDSDAYTIVTEYIENKFEYKKSLFSGYVNEAVYVVKYDNLQIITVN